MFHFTCTFSILVQYEHSNGFFNFKILFETKNIDFSHQKFEKNTFSVRKEKESALKFRMVSLAVQGRNK